MSGLLTVSILGVVLNSESPHCGKKAKLYSYIKSLHGWSITIPPNIFTEYDV